MTRVENHTVSVVILTCGEYRYLERTVASVLEQTCPIRQIILSDDGSGLPFPQAVVNRLERAGTGVIFRRGETNLGTVAHMNLLAGLCDSTYLKFLSAGDAFSDPEALRALVSAAERDGTMAVASNVIVCSEDLSAPYYRFPGAKRGGRLNCAAEAQFSVLAGNNLVSAAGTLLHRRFFTVFGGFDEEYRLLEDWPAWLRMTRTGNRIAFLDRVTCLYALGGVSSKDGSAFDSSVLRADMRRCCQKELLPYWERIEKRERRRVQYHYAVLTGASGRELLRQYFRMELEARMKRKIKRILFFLSKFKRA